MKGKTWKEARKMELEESLTEISGQVQYNFLCFPFANNSKPLSHISTQRLTILSLDSLLFFLE